MKLSIKQRIVARRIRKGKLKRANEKVSRPLV